MATVESLKDLLIDELRDLYDAERRLTKAIPKLAKKAANEELRTALENHLSETEEHVTRLESAFEQLDETAKAKKCAGMMGLIEEGDEHAGEDFAEDSLRDATIIGAAQRVEHYEMAAYGTAIAHARLVGEDEVAGILEETLEEEKAADQKLTEIAENIVNIKAGEGESEEEEGARGRGRRAASQRSTRTIAAARGRGRR
jgi:ferritin-like metal-binding protein YciE